MFGVSMLNVSSICKDNKGFIWTASRSGVMRLTDDSYRAYSLPFEKHNAIVVKLIYQNSELLAYTNNGQLFRYNEILDKFDSLLTIRKFNLDITNVLADNNGTYWLSTNAGLYKLMRGVLSLQIPNVDFRNIAWYDDKQIITVANNKISLLDIHTWRNKTICLYPSNQSIDITKLFYDKIHRRLWIGTLSSGLYYLDFSNYSFHSSTIKGLPRQPILAIEANSDTTMLLGIDGRGVWKLDSRKDKLLDVYTENMDNPTSLAGNGVYDIYCDKQNGRVWVCSFSGGISYFEQTPMPIVFKIHQINNVNSLCNNGVNKICEDSNGNLWFATNDGVSCWNARADKWRTYYNKSEQTRVFLSLCEDNEGRMWCGTYSSGIYVLDGKSGRELAHYTAANTSNNVTDYVFDVFKDSQGDIWIGGNRGNVSCFLSKERKFKKYPLGNVYSIIELSHGEILFGCAHGLSVLSKQTGKIETFFTSSPCKDITYYKGYIWLCSSGDGLLRFNLQKKKYEKVKTKADLPSNFLSSIMEFGGFFWIGTENGLCRFNPSTLAIDNISSLSVVSFNRDAHCILKNRFLAWGTNRGVAIVDPILLKSKPVCGKIFIQDVLVSGLSVRDGHAFKLTAPIDALKEITLKYNQNNLTVQLLPLGQATTKTKFSWILEGLDVVPTSPSDYRTLAYSNIPSGKFRLKIRMFDDSGSRLLAEREFIVRVTPPFWGMWWFRLLSLTIILGLLYFFVRFYVSRLKQRHAEDKMYFFTNMAHEIRTTITLIKSPLEELNKIKFPAKEKYYLNLATEQARRLSTTVTQLLDFQKADVGKDQLTLKMVDVVQLIRYRVSMFEAFARDKNIEVKCVTNPSVYKTALDEFKMERVVDNLISNAIKYSHSDRPVEVLFTGDETNWVLDVKDYGIGIDKETQQKLFQEFFRGKNAINNNIVGSGIGLLLTKNYVSLHGGSIQCMSKENEGSTFRIILPYIEVPMSLVEQKSDTIIESKKVFEDEFVDGDSGNKMRLLVVEDNIDLQNFMQYALSDEFDVSTASDGVFAWEMIKNSIPDIIISDVMMPNMDGFELCRLIKSTYETSHIPVVLLTALAGKAEQLHGLGLGADSYLTKPFDMSLVKQNIKSIIRNREIVKDKAIKPIEADCEESFFINELNDSFIKKAAEIVWANMTNIEFDKVQFASELNVSPSLLYKKIKSLTNKSPNEFVNSIKMNYALDLLQGHLHSVTEISEMCGFSSLDYFGKAFRKYFGKSPSEINPK